VLDDPSATQQQVDSAKETLSEARAALKADDDSSWFENGAEVSQQGSGTGLVFIAARDWSLHTGVVKVDDIPLTEGLHYKSESGSTKTTLLPGYHDTLQPGEHTISVEFSFGPDAEGDIFIMASDMTPGQGDGGDTGTGGGGGQLDSITGGSGSGAGGGTGTGGGGGGTSPKTGDGTSRPRLALASVSAIVGLAFAWTAYRRWRDVSTLLRMYGQ
jgi:hypothetical protein